MEVYLHSFLLSAHRFTCWFSFIFCGISCLNLLPVEPVIGTRSFDAMLCIRISYALYRASPYYNGGCRSEDKRRSKAVIASNLRVNVFILSFVQLCTFADTLIDGIPILRSVFFCQIVYWSPLRVRVSAVVCIDCSLVPSKLYTAVCQYCPFALPESGINQHF